MAVMLSDLFDQEGVKCPKFLADERIMSELLDSKYTFVRGVHTWEFKDEYRHIIITFDNEVYTYKGFDDEGNEIYIKEISKDSEYST